MNSQPYRMRPMLLLAATAAFLFASCKKDNDNRNNIFKGPDAAFHGGKAWTWIQIDPAGNPEKIAIAIDDAAMNSLNMGGEGGSGHDHSNSLSLALHPKAGSTVFKHALLDWNPTGHEPAGVYDLPHFDFHFYMTSEADRIAIPAPDQDMSKFLIYPDAAYLPVNYVAGPPAPQMGLHWVDVTSPELNGQTFTQTFIYGSYDGKVTFYEPMITKAFIDSKSEYVRDIPVPSKFAESGFYPTRMHLVKGSGLTNIILEGFVYRQAS